jgi:hypothetical protein
MLDIKKWQCPHCRHDSARRWNMVEHIRRWHAGMGRPVDNGDSGQDGPTFPSDLYRQPVFRRHFPKYYKSNRISGNNPIDSRGEGSDMIEETHKTVTEMEEKRRKVEEIIAILQKYCNASSWTSNVERGSIFPKNVVQSPLPTDFCRKPPEPKPPMPTPKSCEIVARQESTKQKISQESTSRNAKKRWSIRTIYLVDPKGDDWSETRPQNPTWVCKLNLFGDIIDTYNVSPD